jgi:hypothetical protein
MKLINATRDFTERDRVESRYRELMANYYKNQGRTEKQAKDTTKIIRWIGVAGIIVVVLLKFLTK